ncbi:MAG: DegV family protein [Bacilli bacterium]|nr:DegV family protein [Bacilli bacterium]
MSEYVILADSCMDLSAEQRQQFKIEKPVPGSVVYPDGTDHLAAIDWEEISFEDFYHRLDKKENFKTGLPNQYLIGERVEEYFKQGKDIIAVTLSSGMSGTYNSFLLVKRDLEEKYPERHLYVVDSKRYSGGISILCVLASLNRDKGMSAEENFKWLEEKKRCLHQVGMLDNLFFLQRSGRISKAKAFFGTMAGVKPMADFSNETGMPCVLGNARGYKAGYKVADEFLKALLSKQEPQVMICVHSIREEQCDEFVKIAKANAPEATVLKCRMGQSNGVNVGPGLIALFFFSDSPVSKDCEEERKLLASILSKK